MSARVVSLAGGVRWLAEGWRLFRVAPPSWLALVFVYWILMTAVSFVPLVGLAVATILIPAFSVGFMAAARSCESGRAPGLALLFEGFRGRWAAQLVLGGAYLVLLALLLSIASLADGGELARWMLTGQRPVDEALESDGFFAALAIAASLYVPVMMLYWFAPVLAAWHAMSAAQALFYSFFASLINWRAFLGYGLAAGVVAVLLPLLILYLVLLVAGDTVKVGVLGLVFPILIILLPVLFASFYASYRDVFGAEERA